jgi:selenide,water dikinase
LLSKPLGVGLILRGYKLGLLDEAVLATAISIMTTSNASASAAMVEAGVHASTDVTGFGMLGHLAEMLTPDLGAILELATIPVLSEALSLPPQAARTIWIENNYEYATAHNKISGVIEVHRLSHLLDPQTNGGLIVSASRDAARRLQDQGFSVIGQVTQSVGFEIRE